MNWEDKPAPAVKIGDITSVGEVTDIDYVLPGNRLILVINGANWEREWYSEVSVRKRPSDR